MKKFFTLSIFLFLAIAGFGQLRFFYGNLSGANEVPANASTAGGITIARFNTLTKVIELFGNYSGLTTSATASHIHQGPAGSNGGVIITLTNTGGTAGTLSGTGTLTGAQETDLLAGNLYVNVHNATFSGGEIRSQLTAVADGQAVFLNARLQGAQEVPPNASTANGMSTVLLNRATNKVYLTGSYSNLTNPISGSHIHLARPEFNGSVIVSLTNSGGTTGTVHGEATLTDAQRDSTAIGKTYVNIHSTPTYAGGEIRGQLIVNSQLRFFGGRLSGANEVPSNASLAVGTVIARFDTLTNELEVTGDYQNLTTTISASHIHIGSAGLNGGVVFGLTNTGGVSGTLNATAILTQAQEDSLMIGKLYANVHSTTFGGGEIRTQLLPQTSGQTQYARNTLSNAQEVPTNASTATGTVTAIVDRITGQAYVTGTYTGLSGTISGSHIHRGQTGVNGPVIMALTNSGGTSGTVSGSQLLSQALVDSFVNGNTYANIHSSPTFTGGEIRTQLGNVVLPVKLAYFNGYKERNNIILVWEALNEVNVKHYEIEQQNTETGLWLSKSMIASNGNGRSAYKAEDVPLVFKQAFVKYRLKSVDKDGSTSYSAVVKINFAKAEAALNINANPVTTSLNYVVTGLRVNQKMEVTIVDQNGRSVHRESVSALGNQMIDIATLANGVYTLRVQVGDELMQKRFVKQ